MVWPSRTRRSSLLHPRSPVEPQGRDGGLARDGGGRQRPDGLTAPHQHPVVPHVLPPDHELVELEFLEIKAQSLFEKRTVAEKFPTLREQTAWYAFLRATLPTRTGVIKTRSAG